jgi:hypothetical protein
MFVSKQRRRRGVNGAALGVSGYRRIGVSACRRIGVSVCSSDNPRRRSTVEYEQEKSGGDRAVAHQNIIEPSLISIEA